MKKLFTLLLLIINTIVVSCDKNDSELEIPSNVNPNNYDRIYLPKIKTNESK